MYGPYIESLKGNSAGIKPRQEIKDEIKIPCEIYKKNSKMSYELTSSILMSLYF